ncbi:MAG TPA: DUF3341 domain-containing protein [Tepidisphaeraceae bacterium]|nr:DUF3341 domain-containing protein [Tepidisphaeraceae bacterium]
MAIETEQSLHRPAHLFGLAASFDSPEATVAAARRIFSAGYRHAEGYSPYAVEGLAEALGFHRTGIGLLVFMGGVFGGLGGYFMLWYANVISYPWNIGGKQPDSWPAFIPITFEMTVLGAALLALFGMLILNGLPRPYHPMFRAPTFELASQTRFFLCIEVADPMFDLNTTRQFLESLGPLAVMEVPW